MKREKTNPLAPTNRKALIRSRTLWGIVCVIVAAAVAVIGLPTLYQQLDSNTPVVVAKETIPKGSCITGDMLTTVSIPDTVVASTYFTSPEEVIGRYAVMDIAADDYLTTTKLASAMPHDAYLYSLPDDKLAISVEIPSFSAGLSAKLVRGDVVSIARVIRELEESTTTIRAEVPPELQYVRVLAVTNATGEDVDNSQRAAEGADPEETENKTITLEVNAHQANVLAALDNEKALHLIFVCRGVDERAGKFLQEQEKLLQEQEKLLLALEAAPPVIAEEEDNP